MENSLKAIIIDECKSWLGWEQMVHLPIFGKLPCVYFMCCLAQRVELALYDALKDTLFDEMLLSISI